MKSIWWQSVLSIVISVTNCLDISNADHYFTRSSQNTTQHIVFTASAAGEGGELAVDCRTSSEDYNITNNDETVSDRFNDVVTKLPPTPLIQVWNIFLIDHSSARDRELDSTDNEAEMKREVETVDGGDDSVDAVFQF